MKRSFFWQFILSRINMTPPSDSFWFIEIWHLTSVWECGWPTGPLCPFKSSNKAREQQNFTQLTSVSFLCRTAARKNLWLRQCPWKTYDRGNLSMVEFSSSVLRVFIMTINTGKNNGFPILDIFGYLKNTHKNPKFGKVRQKFPNWDLSHSPKFGIFVGIL